MSVAHVRTPEMIERLRTQIILSAAKLFLTNGYTSTSVREIAQEAGLPVSKVFYEMKSKEDILWEIVRYVLEGQFTAAARLTEGRTEDRILFYAVETTLQLYLAEASEHIRELYAAAYSMARSQEYIQRTVAVKLEGLFAPHLPELESKDFYELEIASGGIMRGFMMAPCDMYFTMERKVIRFLETALRIYRVPDEKIREAVAFVSQYDFPAIARQTVKDLLGALERRLE